MLCGRMARSLGPEAPRFLAALRTRWWLVGLITLVAVGCAIAVSEAQTDRYQASAVMLFGPPSFSNSPLAAGGAAGTSASSPQDQATEIALASLDTVAARVKQRLPDSNIGQLEAAVSVQPKGSSSLVAVTANWATATGAAAVANAFAEEIVAFRRETAQAGVQQSIDAINNTISAQEAALAGRAGGPPRASPNDLQSLRNQLSQLQSLKAIQTGDVQIVEQATPPVAPSSPRVARNAIIGAFIGLVLGIFGVLLLAQFDDRIRGEPDLTFLLGAPVLARIPKVPRSKRLGHTSSVQQHRAFVEAFEFLRLNLQLTGLQQGHVVVGVTSLWPADGKTTVVACLARTLALSGAEVIAVDFDLRIPTLHASFGVPQDSAGGVVGALLESNGHADLEQETEFPHLQVLPAGPVPPPPGLITQKRLKVMFARLRAKAEYVLVDTSPLSIGADASAVVAAADGVVLVIDPRRTRRSDLLAAKRQLSIARMMILGIVVNRARAELPSYYAQDDAAPMVDRTIPPTFTG